MKKSSRKKATPKKKSSTKKVAKKKATPKKKSIKKAAPKRRGFLSLESEFEVWCNTHKSLGTFEKEEEAVECRKIHKKAFPTHIVKIEGSQG